MRQSCRSATTGADDSHATPPLGSAIASPCTSLVAGVSTTGVVSVSDTAYTR